MKHALPTPKGAPPTVDTVYAALRDKTGIPARVLRRLSVPPLAEPARVLEIVSAHVGMRNMYKARRAETYGDRAEIMISAIDNNEKPRNRKA